MSKRGRVRAILQLQYSFQIPLHPNERKHLTVRAENENRELYTKANTAVPRSSAVQGFGWSELPGNPYQQEVRGHAEATHKNCPSYSKYRPLSQYILCHTTRDCVTSLLRVRWTMTGCLFALRPCHPVVLTIVATEQRTVLRNWLDLTGIRTIDYCKTARQTGYKTRPGVVR